MTALIIKSKNNNINIIIIDTSLCTVALIANTAIEAVAAASKDIKYSHSPV